MEKETLKALDNLLTYFARETGVNDVQELYPDFQKVDLWFRRQKNSQTLRGFISTTEESDLQHFCLRFYPETAEKSIESLTALGKKLVPAVITHDLG